MDVFFNLPGVGELMIEHSFYLLDGAPILFVCKDANEIRFLCSCYQMDKNWVIGQTEEKSLLDMIDDQITIREAFKRCALKWDVAWDGMDFRFETDVPDDILPRKGALLELTREQTGQYREALMESYQQRLLSQTQCDIETLIYRLLQQPSQADNLLNKSESDHMVVTHSSSKERNAESHMAQVSASFAVAA